MTKGGEEFSMRQVKGGGCVKMIGLTLVKSPHQFNKKKFNRNKGKKYGGKR